MAAREVDAIFSTIGKVCAFAIAIEERFYKGSADVAAFKTRCSVLGNKDTEWREQLRRFGTDVRSNGLLELAHEANEIREKQKQYVEKLENSRYQKWKKIAFPTKLTNLLARMEEIVDARPKLLQSSVDAHELLEKKRLQTPAPLTFDYDRKYVPIRETVRDVQNALEHNRVVTLYGIPGLGKTSLAKHVAVTYAKEKDQGMHETPPKTPRFPDGVQYMFCGKGSQDKVKDLLHSLVQNLGFAADVTSDEGIDSLRQQLTSCLAKQTLLIIFDDVWELEALQKLLVAAPGVRYLVTSQNKGIWIDAKQIQLKRPTDPEAVHIMANHTAGLPTEGEFPDSIKNVTDGIIRKLDNHPLSLANIGISIDDSKTMDVGHWEAKKDDVFDILGAPSDVLGRPLLHDSTYNLPVNASMMLMVDFLDKGARSLLFLMALFERLLVPERMLKFFFKFILKKPNVTSTYDSYVKYLKDRVIIEYQSERNEDMLLVHGLRMHYIQEEKGEELRNIASQIFVETIDNRKADIIQRGDSEETLAVILGAVYFRSVFKDIVGDAFEKHWRIINDGDIVAGDVACVPEKWQHKPGFPAKIENGNDLFLFVKFFMEEFGRNIQSLFLSGDRGKRDWQQAAHGYAKKISIKLFCQGRLDDDSMAHLLQLPETAAKASDLLRIILLWLPFDASKPWSVAYPQTMKVLLDDMHKSPDVIGGVLHSESNDKILYVLANWADILRGDPNLQVQRAIMSTIPVVSRRICFFSRDRRAPLIDRVVELMEVVFALAVTRNNDDVQWSAVLTSYRLINLPGDNFRLAVTPDFLTILFKFFISGKTPTRIKIAGRTLGLLAVFTESRMIFRAVDGSLESLCDIVTNMEGTWRATLTEKDHNIVRKRAALAAGILAELAVEKELRETIARLPGVEDGLLFLQVIEMGRLASTGTKFSCSTIQSTRALTIQSTRALTTIYWNSVEPRYRDLPRFEQVLEVSSCDEGPNFSIARAYFVAYWSRAEAHLRMGNYGEIIANLDLAEAALCTMENPKDVWLQTYCPWCVRTFVLALLPDGHAAALLLANEGVEENPMDSLPLLERGVLKRRMGDLQGAFQDLNTALQLCQTTSFPHRFEILKHRGYVRHLIGNDDKGAKEDAESATQLKLAEGASGEHFFDISKFWRLGNLPLEYLGYVL